MHGHTYIKFAYEGNLTRHLAGIEAMCAEFSFVNFSNPMHT